MKVEAPGLPANCDVAVIGAGPSGTAVALGLRRLAPSRTTLLIDAGVRQRPQLGETLVQEARGLLEYLGLWDDFVETEAATAEGTLGAWGGPSLEPHPLLFCRPGRGWCIQRPAFAELMTRAARQQGVHMATGTRLIDIRFEADSWTIQLEKRGKPHTLGARFVVDATGRPAFLARRLGARKVRFDRLVGAFVTFPLAAPDTRAAPEARVAPDTWVEADELGFWYAAPRDGGRLVVAFMTDADLARERGIGDDAHWLALFRGSAMWARLISGQASGGALGEPLGLPSIRPLDSHRLDMMTGERWLAVGDAAMTVDHLVSQGLHQALDMGNKAATAVVDDLAGRRTTLRRYQRAAEQRFEDLLLHRQAIYARESRWPEAPFWHRRQGRAALDFDQLVAFTESAASRERLEGLGMHLPNDQLRLLCSLCTAPRLVHAVIQAFKERDFAGAPPPDQRVLSALQYLVEQGLITAE